MKLNLNKLFVVYKPTRYSEKVDVFDGRPDTLAGLFRQVLGGLRIEQVHSIYTTKNEAQKEADQLLLTKAKKTKKKSLKPSKKPKMGKGYAIFGSEVKAEDKYRLQSKPKVYTTKAQAEKELARMIKKGWKRSELKILKY